MSDQQTDEANNPAGADSDNNQNESDAKIAALEESIRKLEQNNLLLKEEKQRKAAEADQAKEQAAKEAQEKAEKDNDFKQLFESSQQEAAGFKSQLEALQNEIATGKLNTEAAKIAGQLTTNTAQAELLAEKIAGRLQDVDGAFKVTDAAGNLTVSTYEELKTELSNLYPFLVDGSKASGGNAAGGSSSTQHKALADMNDAERIEFKNRDPDGFTAAIKGK